MSSTNPQPLFPAGLNPPDRGLGDGQDKGKTMRIRLFISAAMILALLTCCTKIERDGVQEELGYNVAVGKPRVTKAGIITGSEYPETESFASYAYWLSEGKSWQVNRTEAVEYLSGVTVSRQNDGTWKNTTQSYYWPEAGSLSFISHSPADLGLIATDDETLTVSSSGLILENYNVKNHPGIDFMVADPVYDQTGGTVSTLFRHKLARVIVKAALAPSEDKFTVIITGLRFTNLAVKGDYKLSYSQSGYRESWAENKEDRRDMVVIDAVADEKNSVTLGMSDNPMSPLPPQTVSRLDGKGDFLMNGELVIPQFHVAGSALEITYDELKADGTVEKTGINKSIMLTEIQGSNSWEQNKVYTYSLVFFKGSIPIKFTASVGEWGDQTGNEVIIN